ncbi:MAG: hypothetical protein U9R25_19610 [Chloroflexota bacterium]|nr:hypothetical protein [Chloroflexota bacterium]
MAKKVRKRRSQKGKTNAQAAAAPASTTLAAPATGTTAPAGTGGSSGQVDLAAEYHYVAVDLRRLFIVAGVMLIILIALNFIIQ